MRALAAAVLTAASLLCLSSPSAAQSSAGPQQGDWAGEGSIGGGSASLLRFRSPESAWVLGWAGLLQRHDEDENTFGFESDRTVGLIEVSLGLRRYSRVPGELRPFTTWGLTALVSDLGGLGATWRAGPFFELGAAYLVREHVMLSVSGSMNLTYSQQRASSIAGENRVIELRVPSPRVALLLYF